MKKLIHKPKNISRFMLLFICAFMLMPTICSFAADDELWNDNSVWESEYNWDSDDVWDSEDSWDSDDFWGSDDWDEVTWDRDGALWSSNQMPSTRQMPRLYDAAQLLTASEQQKIQEQLDSVSEAHSCNIAILTVDSHQGEIQAYADDYFDYNGFQADYNGSGILFMLSMNTREYAFSTCGNGIDAFTDYGQQEMFEKMRSDLADDDYYGAFKKYIEVCDQYLKLYEEGKPYDVGGSLRTSEDLKRGSIICVIIGFVLGIIPVFIMYADLYSVKARTDAAGYQTHSGLNLTTHNDRFIRSSVSKVKRAEESRSSGGGGSSTHFSSSGSSHGGSSGHF